MLSGTPAADRGAQGSPHRHRPSSDLQMKNANFVPLSQASLGGKVRLMVTGAAPVSATVLTFLRAALGCQVRL